jgi:hypothetical protein
MLSAAQKRIIYQGLPTSVVVSGKTLTVVKRYVNQYTYEQFPAITLEYSNHQVERPGTLDNNFKLTDQTTESIEFDELIDTYALEMDYAMDIIELTGVVAGNAYTFLTSEYQLVGGTHPYHTSVEFLGPTYPDDETDFTITYHHAWVRRYVGGMFSDTLIVNVWTKDAESSNPLPKAQLNGILIADQLAMDVWKFFKYNAEDITGCLFALVGISNIADLDFQVVGEEVRRRQITMDVWYTELFEMTVKESIEDVVVEDMTMNQ